MEDSCKLEDCIQSVKNCSDSVESFLDGSQLMIDSIIYSTKVLADFAKHCRTYPRPTHVGGHSSLLGDKERDVCELFVNGFDSEQIWQGIEISNEPLLDAFKSKVSEFGRDGNGLTLLTVNDKNGSQGTKEKIDSNQQKAKKKSDGLKNRNKKEGFSLKTDLILKNHNQTNNNDDDDDDDDGNGEDLETNSENELEYVATHQNAFKNAGKRKSIVDDEFFVLDDMHRFLDSEDKREMRKSGDNDENASEDIDYFAEDDGMSDAESSDDELSKALDRASKSSGRLSNVKRRNEDTRTMMYADFFDEPELHEKKGKKRPIKKEAGSVSDEHLPESQENEDDEMAEESSSDEVDLDGDENDEGESVEESNSETDDIEKDNMSENLKQNSDENTKKSKFEKNSLKMQEVISAIEAENVAQKPWQLVGEATAAKRPKNSLLEENLSFDQTMVAPPTVTEETTETLEQMITQRIKDQAWDDVMRKVKPVEKPFEYKKSLNLDQEKSKVSLAEVYEKQYIKQTEETKEEETNPDHDRIQGMMNRLFAKLDALSNYQFTPKQSKPELKIVSNLPSLEMEETTPITVSTETRLAPEEIYDKKKSELKGPEEKSSTDKNRERREKKTKKREIRKVKEKKLKEKQMKNPGRVVKESKKGALEALKKNKRMAKIVDSDATLGKNLKSSTAFFTKLQESVGKQIKRANEKNVKRKKESVHGAEMYKL